MTLQPPIRHPTTPLHPLSPRSGTRSSRTSLPMPARATSRPQSTRMPRLLAAMDGARDRASTLVVMAWNRVMPCLRHISRAMRITVLGLVDISNRHLLRLLRVGMIIVKTRMTRMRRQDLEEGSGVLVELTRLGKEGVGVGWCGR